MRLNSYQSQQGVSLIEALIAMAIMGFGMLAIVGVQGTLRLNGDVSKQRSEATRVAEQELEALRAFTQVGSGGTTDAEFDAIGGVAATERPAGESNTIFTVTRRVVESGDTKMIEVKVEWPDRTGQTREVSMHDILTRVDPVLSGMLKAPKPLNAIGRRNGRHPTIPPRAHDLSDGTSIFKPDESGTRAWVFNNSTGAITQTCTVAAGVASSGLTNEGCTVLAQAGQLLAGEIRFNLRGSTKDLGTESVMKPMASGNVAWVIDHATQRLVRVCPVATTAATADLTTSSVLPAACTPASMAVSPFSPTDANDSLTAADSEFPRWPSLPATVAVDNSGGWTVGLSSMECYPQAKPSKLVHTTTTTASSLEYYCLVIANTPSGWSAQVKLVPQGYDDGGSAWTTGTTADTYRVCRYSRSSLPRNNEDHPSVYGVLNGCSTAGCRPVTGNLINQNYLVIAGTKSCPTDVEADLPSGDLVNSNTVQHQP